MQRRIWLAQNHSATWKRLQWLRDQPDGIIFARPSGDHTVVIFKERSLIYLLLAEPGQPFPDVAQSRLNINHPFFLVNRHEQAMLLGLLWQSQPQNVCVVGLGGGRIPAVLHHYLPEVALQCLELDPVVIEAAAQFFGVQADERLSISLAEGRAYLARSEQRYDLIFVDAFQAPGQTPYLLTTKEFYSLCCSRLAPGGVVVANFLFNDPLYVARIRTMQAVFKQLYVCLLEEGNRVALATLEDTALTETEIQQRAEGLQTQHQFSFAFVKRAAELQTWSDLSQVFPHWQAAPILTDASPPIGYE